MTLRIATFNVENLDDPGPNPPASQPTLADRVTVMRPQLDRVGADVLCLQEVHSQGQAGARTLAALDTLLQGTQYAGFNRTTTLTVGGDLYDERNLVVLTSFPITNTDIIRDSDGERPSYQLATAIPPDQAANPVQWERPILHVDIDLGNNRTLHVMNLHLKSKIASSIPGGGHRASGRHESPMAEHHATFVGGVRLS